MLKIATDIIKHKSTLLRQTCFCKQAIGNTHPPRITDDLGSNPGTGRYIVAQMTS